MSLNREQMKLKIINLLLKLFGFDFYLSAKSEEDRFFGEEFRILNPNKLTHENKTKR